MDGKTHTENILGKVNAQRELVTSIRKRYSQFSLAHHEKGKTEAHRNVTAAEKGDVTVGEKDGLEETNEKVLGSLTLCNGGKSV